MTPRQPPPNSSDLYGLIFGMNETLGRATQMVADVRDNVDKIKDVQQSQVAEIATIKTMVLEQAKDHADLKASCAVHEARTKALEDRDIERKGALKLLAVLWSAGTALFAWIILNFKTILEFLGVGH